MESKYKDNYITILSLDKLREKLVSLHTKLQSRVKDLENAISTQNHSYEEIIYELEELKNKINELESTCDRGLFIDPNQNGSTLRRGNFNQTNIGEGSTISGGANNEASGESSVIAGGKNNLVATSLSTISGGDGNTITGDFSNSNSGGIGSTIIGGINNRIAGMFSSVLGGDNNRVCSDGSISMGFNTFSKHNQSVVIGLKERFQTNSMNESSVNIGFDPDVEGRGLYLMDNPTTMSATNLLSIDPSTGWVKSISIDDLKTLLST